MESWRLITEEIKAEVCVDEEAENQLVPTETLQRLLKLAGFERTDA